MCRGSGTDCQSVLLQGVPTHYADTNRTGSDLAAKRANYLCDEIRRVLREERLYDRSTGYWVNNLSKRAFKKSLADVHAAIEERFVGQPELIDRLKTAATADWEAAQSGTTLARRRSVASTGTRDGVPKFTPEQLREYAQEYIKAVKSNRPYEWEDIAPNARNKHEYSRIRRLARQFDPTINAPVDENGFADFTGHFYEHNGQVLDNVTLPQEYWGRSMDTKELYLNALIFGEGNRGTPEGWVWHHHQDAGRMQLVRYGIHRATDHVGGAASGTWSAGTK